MHNPFKRKPDELDTLISMLFSEIDELSTIIEELRNDLDDLTNFVEDHLD
jgi:prefoldin subunit 5